jgi:hypothetical protein
MRSVRLGGTIAAAIALAAGTLAVASPEQQQPRSSPRRALVGGHLGNHFSVRAVQFVRIRRSRDGRRVLFVGDFLAACANVSFTMPGFDLRQEVPVDRGGHFSGGGPFHASGPYGTEDGTFEFQGRDRGGRSIAGTARLRMTARTSQGLNLQCDTKSFRWKVIRLSRSKKGGARHGRAYFGRTSQGPGGFPFLVRVAGSKRRAGLTAFEWRAACRAGPHMAGDVEIQDLPISRKGRIKGKTSVDLELQRGRKEHHTYSVRGIFRRRRVLGTLRATVVVRAGGRVVDRCTSGKVRWRAQRTG